jgi:hypothetical protein
MLKFQKFISALAILAGSLTARADKPAWFEQDTKAPQGWTFYCQSEATSEKEALALARAECSRKMCMLFGVEVKYTQTSKETLKDAAVESTVIESCPDVRIVGRIDKKKSIECEEKNCTAYVSQTYPMSEYMLEKKRLNNPPISAVLEKTIIVREGNETFKDPKNCRTELKKFQALSGVGEKNRLARKNLLEAAKKECEGLDYRNSELQSELVTLLFSAINLRGSAYASVVNVMLAEKPKLNDKITFLLSLESIDQSQSVKKVQKLGGESYDSLYFRPNHYSFYTDEIKSCKKAGQLMRAWPKAFFESVTICGSNDEGSKAKDCQDTSYMMIRAQYVGCICNNGAPQQVSRCFEVLSQHINATCPMQMTEDCFRSMSKEIAEKMKLNINSIIKE